MLGNFLSNIIADSAVRLEKEGVPEEERRLGGEVRGLHHRAHGQEVQVPQRTQNIL